MTVWHHNDKCFDYYIRVCGKLVSKRYRDDDLLGDTINPAWLTSHVVGLAEGIHCEEAFHLLPILSDALEESGCDDTDILNHLRSDGTHATGCWVISLIIRNR